MMTQEMALEAMAIGFAMIPLAAMVIGMALSGRRKTRQIRRPTFDYSDRLVWDGDTGRYRRQSAIRRSRILNRIGFALIGLFVLAIAVGNAAIGTF